MPIQVVNGATLICNSGAVPSKLVVLPVNRTLVGNQPAANINDHIPMVNILPFGACVKLLAPCVPATTVPWVAGAPTVMLGGVPALDNISVCPCLAGGIVSILEPGQTTTMIP